MILAVDVHYHGATAKVVGVLFDWTNQIPKEILVDHLDVGEDYVPGEFYKRELPCILKITDKISLEKVEAIIIDGYVFIDNHMGFGLGGHVWEALKNQVPVIGVAKNFYQGNTDTVSLIYRGASKRPLYISAIGISLKSASQNIQAMYGENRIPAILKILDGLTKA